jgi:predicted dehydrogenase
MKIKLGIMSFAHMHALSYAACVNDLADVELTAVWDDDAKRGKAMAKQYKTKFEPKLEKFLALDTQGVIICSENIKHRPMAEAAAKAGKWILCEKPLATTVKDAKAMVDFCEKAKVGLGTAFPCRYATTLIDVKNRIKSGEIGTIYAANCTNNGSYPGGWFADPKFSGGGATMDHIVHVADVLRWMTGKEFTKVYAEIGRQVHPGIKTDDMGLVHMEMEGGIKVAHIASWNRAKSFPTWGDVTMEIVGEKGVIWVDAFGQKIDVYSDKAMKGQWVGFGANSDHGLVSDFVASIRDRREPNVSGIDGLRAVEVTVAAYEASKSGNVVTL